jgi:peptidoglycan/xylan/chitin deacetylase (PgdA/CDA1 family)
MMMLRRLKHSWRKNRHELTGLFNGSLPNFLFSARPNELGDGVAAFCYHTVTPEELRGDLEFLARNGYSTLGGDALLARLRGAATAEPRGVALTFDDGAFNFHQVVLPLLREYGARALAFVAPGMHFDRPPSGCEDVLERPMTWDELREVHASGLVDVESHTYESRYLPEWPLPIALAGVDPRLEARLRGAALALEDDLRVAKIKLEAELPGKVVRHIAFPAYEGTEEGIAAAVRCGYEACHWGLLPRRPVNAPGASTLHISRLSHEYLRRLPGEGRASFAALARRRGQVVRTAWRRPKP